jgi:hypothetical protein
LFCRPTSPMEAHGWFIVVPLIIWLEMKVYLHPLIIVTTLQKQ